MSIRNYVSLLLLMGLTGAVSAAEENKKLTAFIHDHDLFIIVKNEWKNEERLMHFKLDELDPNTVMLVERQDLLPDKKVATFLQEHQDCQHCFVYSSDPIQVEDDKMQMWYIGLPEPYQDTVFMFAMRGEQFTCMAAMAVPNEQAKKWRLGTCLAYWKEKVRSFILGEQRAA